MFEGNTVQKIKLYRVMLLRVEEERNNRLLLFILLLLLTMHKMHSRAVISTLGDTPAQFASRTLY